MFIDSHAHIDGIEYDFDRDEVIKRALDAGVTKILNVGTGDPQSGAFERAVELGEKHSEIYTAIGVHPHDARHYDESAEQLILNLIKQSTRVIAWGEIGLDYYYDNSPRELQREAFRRQLRAARTACLPAIIHTREAEADTIGVLRDEYSGASRGGIMHCFSGSLELAREAIELGFLISFSGNLTFKKAEDIRAVASSLPLDRLLIETDCPYLTPVPFRGKRNEPARVVEVARTLAGLHHREVEDVGTITSENFDRLFNLR
jgi:TatD DNase family protein